MVHYDLDAREAAGHIFQHGHLVRQDVVIEDRSQFVGFAPQRVLFLRIKPSGLRMIDRAEPHPLKAVLLNPIAQALRHIRIFGVE